MPAHHGHISGGDWNSVHEGYFSNRDAARPLVAAILKACSEISGTGVPPVRVRNPGRTGETPVPLRATIVDLGGGTGFILEELLKTGIPEALRLINLDALPAQLAVTNHSRIERLHQSVEEFHRSDLRTRGPVLFVMRSVLHYAGQDGVLPLLRHLRRQMRPGEKFVHQTVCFPRRQEADFANRVYALMETGKWLPTVRELRRQLAEAGLPVMSAKEAPPLPLSVEELTRRYRLSPQTTAAIREIFTGWKTPALPYKVFVCAAR